MGYSEMRTGRNKAPLNNRKNSKTNVGIAAAPTSLGRVRSPLLLQQNELQVFSSPEELSYAHDFRQFTR